MCAPRQWGGWGCLLEGPASGQFKGCCGPPAVSGTAVWEPLFSPHISSESIQNARRPTLWSSVACPRPLA